MEPRALPASLGEYFASSSRTSYQPQTMEEQKSGVRPSCPKLSCIQISELRLRVIISS